jgi:hypothetical protein
LPPLFANTSAPPDARWRRLFLCGIAAFLLGAGACRPAFAHDFGLGGGYYADFLAGGAAVLNELPVVISLASAGIFIGLWNRDGFPQVWPPFALGVIAGILLAPLGLLEPVSAAYGLAIALGLLAAAAVRPGMLLMRIIMFLAGLFAALSILAGHAWGEVPVATHAGLFLALNAGLSMATAIVALSLQRFDYPFVPVAFRALASWLVAIAVMAFAFLMRAGG